MPSAEDTTGFMKSTGRSESAFFGSLASRIVDGKYRIEEFIGSGGVGVIYAAEHVGLRERVALKFLSSQWAKDAAVSERFLREARTQFKIASENITRVLDVGTTEWGTAYFVMELVDGISLRDLVDNVGRMTVGHATEIVRQGCLGLAAAHEIGVVHRDVKGGNMMLTERQGRATVKVLDFGLADVHAMIQSRVSEARLTPSDLVMGTPSYMAPEQLLGARHSSARSDIWSMGIVLHELLTGSKPFEFIDLARCHHGAELKAIPRVDEIIASIPRELSDIVTKCLAFDPEARYRDGAELAHAVTPFATPFALTNIVPLPCEAPQRSLTMAQTTVRSADGHTAYEVHELVELRTGSFPTLMGDTPAPHEEETALDPELGLESSIPSMPPPRRFRRVRIATGALLCAGAVTALMVSFAALSREMAPATAPTMVNAAAPPAEVTSIELDVVLAPAPPGEVPKNEREALPPTTPTPPTRNAAVPLTPVRVTRRPRRNATTPVPLATTPTPFSPYVDRW